MENYFSKNLKKVREKRGYSQSELSRITQRICDEYNKTVSDKDKLTPITQASIARWELGENSPSVDNIVLLKNALKVELVDLIGKDLTYDNAEYIDIDSNVIKIPVLGVIKAGTPIEAQEDILEYVEIPKNWTKGGKSFYGLKISGDSMYPKYQTDDIVIFEQNEDIYEADNHDCAILVNGFDATFKKFKLNQNGITLIPYNQDNFDGFETTYYDSQQVQDLPIKIIGIAREKRTRL